MRATVLAATISNCLKVRAGGVSRARDTGLSTDLSLVVPEGNKMSIQPSKSIKDVGMLGVPITIHIPTNMSTVKQIKHRSLATVGVGGPLKW